MAFFLIHIYLRFELFNQSNNQCWRDVIWMAYTDSIFCHGNHSEN